MTVVLRHAVYPYESACIKVTAASQVSKQRGMYANPGKNVYGILDHSDLNDQNLFHCTIDTPPGVPGVSKNLDDQTKVYSGQLEH